MAGKTFDLSVIFRVLDKASGPIKKVTKNFKTLGDTAKKAGKKMGEVGRDLALKVTLPLTLMGGLATKAAIDFETAFTGIRKTVEATEPQFAKLKKDLMGLALTIPVATTELFGVAEAAGQLGVKQQDILKFTKVMADLGATTNLSSEEAATQLARFANVVGVSSDDFDKLGSSIVDLGNNMAANEQEIVMMGGRLAKTGTFAGLSASEIMGLSAALVSVGINAEAGGTAFSQVMFRIGKELGTGSKKMKGFAAVSGKPVKVFEKLWKEDAAEAMLLFTEGLKRAETQGHNVNIILDQLGLDGIRVASSLLAAAAAGNTFRGAIERSNKAWIENTALSKEAALRYKTAASQLAIARNRATQMAAAFGAILVPAILKLLKVLEPVVDWLTKLSPEAKTIIVVIGGIVAAIGPLLMVLGFLTVAVGALGAAALPIVAIIAAFVGLGFAIWQAYRAYKLLKEIMKSGLRTPVSDKHKAQRFKIGADGSSSQIAGEEGESGGPGGGGESMMKGFLGRVLKRSLFMSNSESGAKGLAGSGGKSETDININVSSDQGSMATVEKVKKKSGDATVNTMTAGYVGAF